MLNVRLMCIAAIALAVASVPVYGQGIHVGNDGWTVITPSPDTRRIYISSSTGNDSNSGLSESAPKRTLAAGFALLRSGYPDWLHLKSGDTWEDSFPFWNKSGRSPSERMVVRAYGTGPRPRILTGIDHGIHINPGNSVQGVRHLVFMDLHFNAHTNAGTAGVTGFLLFNGAHHILIENCYTENFRVNMIFQAFAEGIRASNIAVRRSVIVDALATNSAHAQGIFADGVDGLIMEENIFDMNGWSHQHATANIFRHNIYIQTQTTGDRGCTDVETRGNITARASATGFMMRTGGISEDNLYLQNPVGLQFGQTSGPASSGIVRNNVFLDARDVNGSTPRGLGMNLSYADGMEVYGNILAHQRTGTDNIQAIGVDGTYRNLIIRDNIVHNWNRPGSANGRSLGFFGTPLSGIVVDRNEFQQPMGGFMIGMWAPGGAAFNFRRNQYYSTNNGNNQFFSGVTYNSWLSMSGETQSTWSAIAYPDPSRDIARYMAHLGRPASLEAFMTEARKQARHYWRPEFTAASANTWIRQGFGLEPATWCYANCDESSTQPSLNIDDFVCFITQFASAQSLPHAEQVNHYANCDGSSSTPALNVDDFVCFIDAFMAGCP